MSTTNELERIIENQESEILSHISSITYLIQVLKEEREKKFKKFNNEECWIYSATEDNHLETLACPVVISAVDLQELINTKNEFERISNINVEVLEIINDELLEENSGLNDKIKSLELHLEDVRSSVGSLALTISKELGTDYKETNIGNKLRNLQDVFNERFIYENS